MPNMQLRNGMPIRYYLVLYGEGVLVVMGATDTEIVQFRERGGDWLEACYDTKEEAEVALAAWMAKSQLGR
jgi:hypothetical protein